MLFDIPTLFFCFAFFLLRTFVIQSMQSLFDPNSNLRYQIKSTLNEKPITRKQYERENVTWISVLISAFELYILFAIGLIPPLETIPFFSIKSIFYCILSHLLPVEFIYYWVHVWMHHPSVYSKLHKHHHLSIVPSPKTSVSFLPYEHIFYDLLFAIPILLPVLFGEYSMIQILLYVPLMDLANTLGHTNVEMLSLNWYNTFSGLFFYSSSFHHVHHKYFKYNYALFVPIYDYIFGTYNVIITEKEHTEAFYRQNKNNPKYAFLIHIIDNLSIAKSGFFSKDFARTNDISKLSFIQRMCVPIWNFIMAFIFKNIPIFMRPNVLWNLFDNETRHPEINGVIRPIPLTPLHYIKERENTFNLLIQSCRQIKNQYPHINTIGLAAMNKNKVFSNNGKDMLPFINSMGIWVVTGNTMTAAAVCEYVKRDIPQGSKIFINGATSSIGYAVVSKCSLLGYDVTFYTKSEERAKILLAVLKKEDINNVVWTDDINKMKNFDYLVLGSSSDVTNYTKNTKKILSFAIPSPKVYDDENKIEAGTVALPESMKSDNAMMCSEDTTHACHAGTWVHSINNWEYNEVGKVDYKNLEDFWDSASILGWKLVDK